MEWNVINVCMYVSSILQSISVFHEVLLAPLTGSLQKVGLNGAQTIVLKMQHEHLGAVDWGRKAGQWHIMADYNPKVGHRL
jgi:hypothetical protein